MARSSSARGLVLEGVSHPLGMLASIHSRRIPLVLGPVAELDEPPEYRARRAEDWLSRLVDGDARWALATFGDHPRALRLLRIQAAAAVARGVPREIRSEVGTGCRGLMSSQHRPRDR